MSSKGKNSGPVQAEPPVLTLAIQLDQQTGHVGLQGPLDNMPAVDYMLSEARRLIERRYMKRVELAESGLVVVRPGT